jgi:hypothetical protein
MVHGDKYAGETFARDFAEHGIKYVPCKRSKHELYEAFEPVLNAGEIELLDLPKLQQQLLGLVWRGRKIDHQQGEHDDWANVVAGVVWSAARREVKPRILACIGAFVLYGRQLWRLDSGRVRHELGH